MAVFISLAAVAPASADTGSFSLVFSTQPHNVVVGQSITGADWNPSGPPVRVTVVDAAGETVSGSSAPITITFAANPGGATLGGTTTVNAASGVATFSDLTVNQPAGGYVLRASSGNVTATSRHFEAQQTVTVCDANASCTSHVGTHNGNNGQVVANPGPAGLLLESVNMNMGAPLTCHDYTSIDTNTYDFLTTVDRSKILTLTIKQPSIPLSGSAADILHARQICFGANYRFATLPGTPLTAGTLPDGSPGFIGLLPPCPAVGPCHDRNSDTTIPDPFSPLGFDIVLVADIPAGLPGDPQGRG